MTPLGTLQRSLAAPSPSATHGATDTIDSAELCAVVYAFTARVSHWLGQVHDLNQFFLNHELAGDVRPQAVS